MPRFPGFSRRKSAVNAEDVENAKVATPSFNVLPRDRAPAGKSFDGGARAGRGPFVPSPAHGMYTPYVPASHRTDSFLEPDEDNNMFTVLKTNDRGSGSSNTTKTVSTDNSSRRSDTSSTPPSSTVDLYEDPKSVSKKPFSDIPVPPIPKNPPSNNFFKTAGRTFSFGQKKTATPPASPSIKESPEWQEGDDKTRDRAMTTSTSVTASSVATATVTAPRLEEAEIDMGNDFNTNMFKGLADRRASVIMPLPGDVSKPKSKPTGEGRHAVPAPLQIEKASRVEAPPPSWNGQGSNDKLPINSPPLPRQPSPATDMADDDASLLTDTLLASKWLGAEQDKSEAIPMTAMRGSRRSLASTSDSFLQSAPSVRPAHRFPPKDAAPSETKVMTPAQFERYRQDKERQGKLKSTDQREASDDEDDKYEDDEDEAEKTRQAAKDRNKRQAHMTLYRQQMTKVTGETPDTPPSSSSVYPGMSSVHGGSSSTPNLLHTPPPELVLASEDDGDDDIPLGILQQHGFPSKTRPPMRVAGMRASYMAPTPRSQSSLGGEALRNNRHSALPAFARNLPQDPFVGASVAQPPIRESLPYSGGMQSPPQPQTPGQMPVGGLVGVIMNEERSRAMRRGSPQPQAGKFGSPLLGYDPSLQMPPGIPPQPQHSMYSLNPMAAMSQPSLSQPMYGNGQEPMLKMQMQLMQMQMAQMQIMQNGNMAGMAPQQPHMLGHMGLQDPSAIRHSVATDSLRERPRFDTGSRTMSMVQPSSASWVQPAPSIRIQGIPGGYTPSIAPSERSTMGMPGRYRPVSQMIPANDPKRASAMPGSVGQWDSLPLSKSEPRLSTTTSRTGNSNNSGDSGNKSDDEDEGWAALKAKREKTKSSWKKKSASLGANTFMSGIL